MLCARWAAVSRFKAGDAAGGTFVFLLSTRAGGVGLNLADADTVRGGLRGGGSVCARGLFVCVWGGRRAGDPA